MGMIMTEARARLLAERERYYTARCIKGRWVVWDAKSDHVVEFSFADEMEAVGAALAQ